MNELSETKSNVAQQIAEAAISFQRKRTGHVPKSVTVVLGQDTLVVTLHGALTPAEQALAKSAEGAAQVQDFHRQLFTNSSDALRREIKRITGVEVLEAIAEVETMMTGAVVQVFTTGTMVQVFSSPRACLQTLGEETETAISRENEGVAMLVLSRKSQESVVVGGTSACEHKVVVTVMEIKGGKVRLGFDAPVSVPVHRMEVWERISAETGQEHNGAGKMTIWLKHNLKDGSRIASGAAV